MYLPPRPPGYAPVLWQGHKFVVNSRRFHLVAAASVRLTWSDRAPTERRGMNLPRLASAGITDSSCFAHRPSPFPLCLPYSPGLNVSLGEGAFLDWADNDPPPRAHAPACFNSSIASTTRSVGAGAGAVTLRVRCESDLIKFRACLVAADLLIFTIFAGGSGRLLASGARRECTSKCPVPRPLQP